MTSYRHKMLSSYNYLPIAWTTFLSFRCCRLSQQIFLRIPFGWLANAVVQGYTRRQGTIWIRKTIFCSFQKILCAQFLRVKATHENFLTLKISQINYGTCMYLLLQVEKYECMHLKRCMHLK